jgi:xanthine dehydrogenase accessory factor
VCVLSHDERIDAPALRVALASAAGYVGAMGSRRTHDDRAARLRDAGVAPDRLARLHSPIGLDLGGRSPEETALSILAEIVAVRHGRGAAPRRASGPLHAAP